MRRSLVVVLLILSVTSGTMLVGCTGGTIALEIGFVALQFFGEILFQDVIQALEDAVFGDGDGQDNQDDGITTRGNLLVLRG